MADEGLALLPRDRQHRRAKKTELIVFKPRKFYRVDHLDVSGARQCVGLSLRKRHRFADSFVESWDRQDFVELSWASSNQQPVNRGATRIARKGGATLLKGRIPLDGKVRGRAWITFLGLRPASCMQVNPIHVPAGPKPYGWLVQDMVQRSFMKFAIPIVGREGLFVGVCPYAKKKATQAELETFLALAYG